MTYADVIIDLTAKALDRTFQYRIPPEMEDSIEEGAVIEAAFGNGNRKITGFVVGLSDDPKVDPEKIRPIERVVTQSSDEEKRLTGLAIWIRDRYGSTMAQALRTVLPVRKKVQAREKRVVVLACPKEQAQEALEELKRKNRKARARLLEALIPEGSLPWEVCTEKLHVTAAVIRAVTEAGLTRVERVRVYRGSALPEEFQHASVSLNDAQRRAADRILREWDDPSPGRYLIQGVTGSGKTEVYIEVIAHAVSRGQQAIVLIPEIALTYQTLMRFYHRFGGRVSVIHSRMSAGEKQDQFDRARSGDLDVMIGPRSALFTPFPNLGVIVIDEEHEESYRSEQAPRYHAREVAFQRGKMEGAKVILGSATPSLEASWAARSGEITLLRLEERANRARLAEVTVADMREEMRAGNRSILSRDLRERMAGALSRNEQIMLFLNRRGYAGFVSCRSCGEVIKCPHCDVSLTYHRSGQLICHYCGYTAPMVRECPSCRSPYISTMRAGTEQVEQEVSELFPDARVLRMDRDSTAGKDGQLKILAPFASHEADILIGTQMIVKGHDFPDVTLVGILMADLSLNIPSYQACERTFQLLTQAAGRAGRGEKQGSVVIQTFQPEHYAVRLACAQDYDAFYDREIVYRSMAGYPPAGALTAIHLSCADEEHLEKASSFARRFLEKIIGKAPVQLLGPAPEPIARIDDVWRQVLYMKAGSPKLLRMARERLERYMEVNEGFSTVEVQIDTLG